MGLVPELAKEGLGNWLDKLPDGRSKANARARLNGTEPLGITHPLPPLPPDLPEAAQLTTDLLAAVWGVLLTATTPLTLKMIVDRLRPYGQTRSADTVRFYLDYLTRDDVGLATPIDTSQVRNTLRPLRRGGAPGQPQPGAV